MLEKNKSAVGPMPISFSFFKKQAECHGAARGSRNEETRIETNRVFNVEQTEEAQEHR